MNTPEALKGLYQIDVEYADDPESNTQDFVGYDHIPAIYKPLIPEDEIYPYDHIELCITIGLKRTTIKRLD